MALFAGVRTTDGAALSIGDTWQHSLLACAVKLFGAAGIPVIDRCSSGVLITVMPC